MCPENRKKYKEHSPTQKKLAKNARIKGGRLLSLCVTAPINIPEPTNPWAHHLPAQRLFLVPWRHHPGVCVASRGPATCLRHLTAMQALTWVRVALPRGLACHVASAWVPRHATSARGCCGKITPLCPFFKRIKSKTKFPKIQKIHKSISSKI